MILINQDNKGIFVNQKYVFNLNEFTLLIDNESVYEAAKEQLKCNNNKINNCRNK